MLGVVVTGRAAAAVRVTIDIPADDDLGLGRGCAEALPGEYGSRWVKWLLEMVVE